MTLADTLNEATFGPGGLRSLGVAYLPPGCVLASRPVPSTTGVDLVLQYRGQEISVLPLTYHDLIGSRDDLAALVRPWLVLATAGLSRVDPFVEWMHSVQTAARAGGVSMSDAARQLSALSGAVANSMYGRMGGSADELAAGRTADDK